MCAEIPESCADCIDEMTETATIIKEEVREELNATRARLQSIALDFVKCYTLESSEFLRFGIQANTESYTSCKVRQKADHDVSKRCKNALDRSEGESNLPYERESLTSNPNDLVSLRQPTRGKERALNERAQECGRALDSVESFSCSAATASRLDAPRMTRALRLISTPAMPRPTLAPSILRGSAPCRIRLVPSFTSLGRQEPALQAMASIRVPHVPWAQSLHA